MIPGVVFISCFKLEAHEAASELPSAAESWASSARNLLAHDYAFALFSCAEAKIVQRQLSKLHIEMIIDPMAGSGLQLDLLLVVLSFVS